MSDFDAIRKRMDAGAVNVTEGAVKLREFRTYLAENLTGDCVVGEIAGNDAWASFSVSVFGDEIGEVKINRSDYIWVSNSRQGSTQFSYKTWEKLVEAVLGEVRQYLK